MENFTQEHKRWDIQNGRLSQTVKECIILICDFMSPKSYMEFTTCCTAFMYFRNNERIKNNYMVDFCRAMKWIFDDKENVFITGSAGTGKSTMMNKIYEQSIKMDIKSSNCSTTGISASNMINGRTIHSFSGLRKGNIPIDSLKLALESGSLNLPKIWEETELLLIDEISMNGARFLTKLDMCARHKRQNNKPMGGIQLVISGDNLQLPPVADKFCFTNDVYKDLNFKTVCLRYPFRQSSDMKYYKFLQRIRKGEPTDKDKKWLEAKCEWTKDNMDIIENYSIKPTRFKSKQKEVKRINDEEFDKLKSIIEYNFYATDRVMKRKKSTTNKYIYEPTTEITLNEAMDKLKNRAEHQAPSQIKFRDGAQYMLTFNFNITKKHVNGSKCVYKEGGKLEFLDGSQMKLDEIDHEFSYNIGDNLYVFRKQKAIRLAYACTFHSSQGLTVDSALIDLGPSIFDKGQAYVGMSRVKKSDGLYIENYVDKSIKTHPLAKGFMEKLENDYINKNKWK